MKKLSKKKIKERRKKGIVKAYISRAAAVKKLQIPLSDFRRLCILKGIYPIEPKNKSKLTGGNTRRKTYFFTRDIQSLMNEPLLFKFWEFKVFMKRLTKAKGRHDLEKFQQINDNKPVYQLDGLVKERYPRFLDALRDCDDALSMCFLYAMFPAARNRSGELIDLTRKLTLEFMHYVIHTKSLRKVFISIKGYYYQAEIMGQKITWIVPHQFVIDRVSDVDMNVMKTFTEFYVTLLGFINFKLFVSIGALYPPQIVSDRMGDLIKLNEKSEKSHAKLKRKRDDDEDNQDESINSRDQLIASLNKRIKLFENKAVAKADNASQQPDVFEDLEESERPATDKDNEKMTVQQVLALENLFSEVKVFLSREVPRESLTFVIRSFGGEVSWDERLFPGATFSEDDSSITHQIVDRTELLERRLDRIYVQPQWIYDCVNMRVLLPTDDYLVGANLPPHLSPFVNEKKGDYVPPDKLKMLNLRKQFEAEKIAEDKVMKGEAGIESDFETDNEIEKQVNEESASDDEEKSKKRLKSINNSDTYERNRRKRERDSNKSNSRSKLSVKQGKLKFEDKEELKRKEDEEHRKMGIMMIPKKKKRLFDKITKTQKQRGKKVEKLRAKRRVVDAIRARGGQVRQPKSEKKFSHKTKAR